eukprot:403345748
MLKDFKTEDEVMQHFIATNQKIIIFQGTVYDVTEYAKSHPGGEDLIEEYYGKCIDEPFEDNGHTASARLVFRDLEKVGYIVGDEKQKGCDLGATGDKPIPTGLDGFQLKSTLKIDYSKGLYKQMLEANLSWDDYITFINEPKHLVNPIRDVKLFENQFFELFTMTPWYFIPIAWFVPLVYHTFFENPQPLAFTLAMVFAGIFAWTFTEYILHRFFFHSEDYWLPNHPMVLAHHFMLHGIHHAFPMDRYRLVFPVLPGYLIMYGIIFSVTKALVPDLYRSQLQGGIILGYILYDLIHYFLHHSSPKRGYFKNLKVYHMQHHYKNGTQGFGVSNKFWDYVFQSQIRN